MDSTVLREIGRRVTVCVGADAATLRHLRLTVPTWLRAYPELADWRWLAFRDGSVSDADLLAVLPHGASCCEWRHDGVEYPSQRARMLTAWVFVPQTVVETQWWLKVDADAVCLRRANWLEPEWFGSRAVYVANSWGYTKAKGDGRTGSEWAESLERWGDAAIGGPRLGLDAAVDGQRIGTRRMASWLSLYRTDWTRLLADACTRHCGWKRLPVPSQDTVAWYFAARRCDQVIHTKFKKRGWTNIPGEAKLAAKCGEVMCV